MAHNEFEVLQRLVSLLDDERSDFFIHFDAKVKTLPEITVEKGRLFVLKNRVDVRWGTFSQIETELVLMEAAQAKGPYGHYHILSGTHLPLKPVDELMRFYDEHPEESVARFWPKDEADADFKLRRYHFPLKHFKSGRPLRRYVCQRTWQLIIKIQKILGIRHLKDCVFTKTDQWLSVTDSACRYLLDHKKEIHSKYRWSFCPDEYFVASELLKQPSRFKMMDCANLLFVVFDNDSPKQIPVLQWDELRKTDFYWARKFTV